MIKNRNLAHGIADHTVYRLVEFSFKCSAGFHTAHAGGCTNPKKVLYPLDGSSPYDCNAAYAANGKYQIHHLQRPQRSCNTFSEFVAVCNATFCVATLGHGKNCFRHKSSKKSKDFIL